jgi:ABC-type lipoprotein release transport system permease subunit
LAYTVQFRTLRKSPADPFVFTSVVTLPVAVAMLASLVPAIRASALDPIRALCHQ